MTNKSIQRSFLPSIPNGKPTGFRQLVHVGFAQTGMDRALTSLPPTTQFPVELYIKNVLITRCSDLVPGTEPEGYGDAGYVDVQH